MNRCLRDADIQEYLFGGQSSAQQAAVQDHLAVCENCASRVQQARESSAPALVASRSGALSHNSAGTDVTMSEGLSPSAWQVVGTGESSQRAGGPKVTLDEFLTGLSLSGLLPRDEIQALRERTASDPAVGDVVSVIDWLISEHKLTKYQAEVLACGHRGALILGNYIILEKLGQGGMGTVFLARHRRMNRLVGLKVLPPALSSVPEAIARFQREVQAAARLQHANVAAAYDADEAGGVHFLVMEYVDGPTLSAFVKARGAMPLPAAVRLMAQAARGLAAAHAMGIVHRDIKPSNIMVNRQGVLKVLDLGLAQMHGDDLPPELHAEMTQTGRVMGTVDYMAPEQARNAKAVDHRADIYSLGCTLFYLATGNAPAPPGSAAEKLLWHQTSDSPPLSSLCPQATPRLEALVARMMAKRPEDRPQTMGEIAAELDQCALELPSTEADLAIGDIAISQEHSASTKDGADLIDVTLRSRGATVASLPPLALPPRSLSRGRSRLLVYACGLLGTAVVAAVIAVPMLRRPAKPTTTPVVQPKPGAPHAPGSDPRVAANVNHAGAGGISASPPARSPHAPYEKLLTWVFRNGGSIRAVTGQGEELPLSTLDQLPDQPLDIRAIVLDGTGVLDTELAQLAAAPGLRELSLADTKITDAALAHLENLRQLEKLNLAKTAVTNNGLPMVARLGQLLELDLQKTPITDQGLARLTGLAKLQRLYLNDTAVGDIGIEQLKGLGSLQQVTLNGTSLTEAGHASLTAALPDLNIAWDGADVQRAVALRLLEKGATLGILDRAGQRHDGVKLRDSLPPGRVVLKTIDLSSGTGFADADLKQLAVLPEIESLKLVGAAVTPDGLAQLHGLASLKTIDLGSLRLPAAAVAALQQALANCKVVVKEPADVELARLVIGMKGRVSVMTERGLAHNDLTDVAQLPASEYTTRAVLLDGVAGVDDALVARLVDLPDLESLRLTGTDVTDEGVAQLAAARSLRELSLSRTKVTATGIGALTRLPALARLYLAGTQIGSEGARMVADLPHLTHVSLQGVSLADDDLAQLKRLSELEWLDVSATPASDAALVHLSQLAQLREVNLAGSAITDAGVEELRAALPKCSVLADPPDAQRLAARWLVQNKGTVALETGPLANLKELPRDACRVLAVDLAELGKLNAADVVGHLQHCTSLVSLNLGDTSLREADLAFVAALPELRELSLANLPASDVTLKRLAGNHKLEILDLTGTRVTGAGLADLAAATELKKLLLGNTAIDERYFTALSAFGKLEALNVASSRSVTDAGLAHVEKLKNLRSLDLRGSKVTDAGLDKVAPLTALEELELEGTTVTDTGVAKLASLTKLRRIGLGRTGITDSATSTLAQLKGLKSINLARTKISPESIKSLHAALPGCAITAPTAPTRDPNDPMSGIGQEGAGRGGLGPNGQPGSDSGGRRR